MASEYRCVGCGFRVKSFNTLRGNCKEVADEYIECERMIIFIDLILHRPKVYRHVLYNAINPETVNIQHLLWKLVFAYLLLDSYRSLLLTRTDAKSSFSESSVLISIKVLIGVLSANAAFIFSFAIAAKGLLNEVSRRREIMLGILISSYFKIFLLAMLVWEFPMSVIFIVDILVLTSNSMALKVMTESTTTRCIAVCLITHLVRFLVGQIFEPTTFLTQFGSLMYLSSLFRIVQVIWAVARAWWRNDCFSQQNGSKLVMTSKLLGLASFVDSLGRIHNTFPLSRVL